ncbi:MAG: alpha-L-arabinofuranosidase, partial [Ginsengibacter sp.]
MRCLLPLLILSILFLLACKKNPVKPEPVPPVTPPDSTQVDPNPTDPSTANTIGFFLDDWAPKTFTIPAFTDTALPSSTSVTVNIDAGTIITKVPKSVFGHNANIWMTQMITEPSLMSYVTDLHPNVIRFPGGSLSDIFFWNADKNVPPADAPTKLPDANGNQIDAGYWYGKNAESWTMSVDNYYKMLQQTGNQGMITVNYAYARYGSSADPVAAAAHLAADWVRYDKGRTKYWEIGNEDNGVWEAGYRIDLNSNKDGQPEIITGDLYGKHYNVFADSMRAAAKEIGATIYIGAQLLEKLPESWQTVTDKSWNTGVLAQVKTTADYYIIHSYFTNYQTNASATEILNTAQNNPSAMTAYLTSSLASAGAGMKPIALTEWNITSQGSMQQVSFINGLHAAILLGEALQNKSGMTARWDLANGWDSGNDMGLFNNGDEPGVVKWNARPAYYYMYYFQKMLG